MLQYLDLCKTILEKGTKKEDRTGTGTISYFGYQMRFDMQKGFPLLTTKKVFFKGIAHELLWFISGSTNIKYLVDNGVNIWNEWAYERYAKTKSYKGETLQEYVEKIKNDEAFAKEHGELGSVYGKQWRNFNGVDQLKDLVEQIKYNPTSRRHILSAWNPNDLEDMALPPCHVLMQFYVNDNKLSLQLYQRSGDVFLGIPFNIASYSLLLHMVAQVCNLEVGEFIHTIGDAHIYNNHIAQVRLQMSRQPLERCQLELNKEIKDLFDFRYEDIQIKNYQSHPAIKGAISV